MKPRYVLLLNGTSLAAYRCRRGHAAVEAEFRPGATQDFERFLASRAHESFILLADVADESFALEYVPHVRGRSGRLLVERKRQRHCHGSPLSAGLPQGRQPTGRRDDCVLFVALTRPQLIEPWLQCLHRAESLLGGVYTLPQLVADVVASRSAKACLCVALGRGGLRQTFIADGQLRFSRLTPLDGDSAEEAALACATEAANMRRYLCAQRMIDRDGPLAVLVLVHPTQRDAFCRHCRDNAELRFEYLDLIAAVQRYGLMNLASAPSCDALFAYRLARKPPRRQLAPDEMLWHWRLQSMRQAVDVFAWGATAALLLFSAVQAYDWFAAQDSIAALQAQNERAHGELARRSRNGLPLSSRSLHELAAACGTLERFSSGTAGLLTQLSRALEAAPTVELESLEWRAADGSDHAAGPHAVLDVHGFASDADPQRRQQSAERLIMQLRADAAAQGIVLQQTSALPAQQTLRSADLATDGAFTLRLSQKL